jgi:hypothetical protein
MHAKNDDHFCIKQYLHEVKTNATLSASYHAWRQQPPSHWPRFVPANQCILCCECAVSVRFTPLIAPVTCRMAATRGKRSSVICILVFVCVVVVVCN